MTRPPATRLLALLVVMIVALVAVVVRLGQLQVRRSGELTALGTEQRLRTRELPAARGDIVDRNMTPLAMTLEARDIYANPSLIPDRGAVAARLAPLLEHTVRDLRGELEGAGTFVYLERQVDVALADEVAALRLPGIGVLPSVRRYYPAGILAPQLLGFVGVDGAGLAGLELHYESVLAGAPGERTAELSALGQDIAGGMDVVAPPRPGDDLVLAIDRQIQFAAQRSLRRAVLDNHAKGGTVIVMDPRTGDIYAMASYPWFDPNAFGDYPATSWPNRAVTDTWEPGSVNKVITAAAALETGAVSLTERFRVPAARSVEGYTIHDSHPHPIESMTLGDIIAQSSNIGTSMVADRVGNDALVAAFEGFGYGRPTGVGFPGEAAGLMPPTSAWSDITRATVSFGAGVAVSPLQMATVYATIANGGTLVQPRLVRATIGPDGTRHDVAPSPSRRVVSAETADIVTRMLAYVVEDGTGIGAQIAGYQVAGKTGTAKKLDRNGNYTQRYVASFIGFLPAARPEVVVVAIIDEPDTIYGGIAAAPLFQDVARFSIQRLGIEPAASVRLPPHVFSQT